MKIKIEATRTTVTTKYEDWNDKTGKYVGYDIVSKEQEFIEFYYEHYYVKVINIKQYYCLDRIHLDVNSHPINLFLYIYNKKLKTCRNINDCIKAFEQTIKECDK